MNYTCFFCGRSITTNGEDAADPGPDRPSEPVCSHCERRVSGGASIDGRVKRSDDENNAYRAAAANGVGFMRTRSSTLDYFGSSGRPYIKLYDDEGVSPGRKRAALPGER